MSTTTDSRWTEAVLKLILLTQTGNLKWEALPDLTHLKSHVIGEVVAGFSTTYNDRLLRLIEHKYKATRSRSSASEMLEALSNPGGPWTKPLDYIAHGAVLQLGGDSWFTVPKVKATSDLLTAVQYQVAGVTDFLDRLLRE